MTTQHGFTLLREQFIPEIASTASLYRHDRTGAELLSLTNQDENKVFGITFRTPPSDSTGVAHILEHSVLCGSDKYPTKEPFVELLKGSLQTFLNAFTYPDKTCYPVASQNLKDFYNLVDIYMDAALHPLLTRHTFLQEAWHVEQESSDAPLSYKGVVFNEMKGVYASPESILGEYSQRVLFPDVTYGIDYGGDPGNIPDLTWEQLKAFHARFYHPSNARIYFYGDDEVDERLRRMNEYLRPYDRTEIDSTIARQPAATTPSEVTLPYPSGEGEESGHFVTVNWLLPAADTSETLFGLQLLSHILVGTPAAPLRKALIDSGLGEDVVGAGMETQIQQPFFSVGLKGIKAGTGAEVESLILDSLASLTRDGIDAKTIDASLNTIEFMLREGNTGSYPRGLALMVGVLQTWLYDEDPFLPLQFEAPLKAIRTKLEQGTRYFENLIEAYVLGNAHRVRLNLMPDPDHRNRLDREERARLDQLRESMTQEQLDELREEARILRTRQATPDTPEALATIPILSRDDLDPHNRSLPSDVVQTGEITHLVHELPTQGIVYLDIGFNLQALPPDLLPYMPLWSEALFETGTATEDFVALSQRIGSSTGGMGADSYTSARLGRDDAAGWVFLRGKTMAGRLPAMIDILRDVTTTARLDDMERIRQIALEEKASMEGDIIPSGHRMVGMRLRAAFSTADQLHETLGGLTYFHFLRRLIQEIDTDAASVSAKLQAISHHLFSRHDLVVNLTCSTEDRTVAESEIDRFLRGLPEKVQPTRHPFASPVRPDTFEGWTIPSQVNYVGWAVPLYAHGYRLHGSALVIARYIRSAWLWDQVRVQGGAYGGFSQFDYRSGLFSFVSYRDPNLDRTLKVYEDTADYLENLWLSDRELTKAIIGTIGDFDTYMFPDAKGYVAMTRHLTGDSEAHRQRLREEVLGTTVDHFHQFGKTLKALAEHGHIAVMGSDEAIRASQRKFAITQAL